MEEQAVFTPIGPDGQRLKIYEADVDFQAGFSLIRGPGFKGQIRINNATYDVFGKECSLPNCYCDARLEKVE